MNFLNTTEVAQTQISEQKTCSTFTARWLSRVPVHAVAESRHKMWGWWNISINAGVLYDCSLCCQVSDRRGVLYLRYWSAPVGCINTFNQFTLITTTRHQRNFMLWSFCLNVWLFVCHIRYWKAKRSHQAFLPLQSCRTVFSRGEIRNSNGVNEELLVVMKNRDFWALCIGPIWQWPYLENDHTS